MLGRVLEYFGYVKKSGRPLGAKDKVKRKRRKGGLRKGLVPHSILTLLSSGPVDRDYFNELLRQKNEKYTIYQAFFRLKRQGLIEQQGRIVSITEAGIKKLGGKK